MLRDDCFTKVCGGEYIARIAFECEYAAVRAIYYADATASNAPGQHKRAAPSALCTQRPPRPCLKRRSQARTHRTVARAQREAMRLFQMNPPRCSRWSGPRRRAGPVLACWIDAVARQRRLRRMYSLETNWRKFSHHYMQGHAC